MGESIETTTNKLIICGIVIIAINVIVSILDFLFLIEKENRSTISVGGAVFAVVALSAYVGIALKSPFLFCIQSLDNLNDFFDLFNGLLFMIVACAFIDGFIKFSGNITLGVLLFVNSIVSLFCLLVTIPAKKDLKIHRNTTIQVFNVQQSATGVVHVDGENAPIFIPLHGNKIENDNQV